MRLTLPIGMDIGLLINPGHVTGISGSPIRHRGKLLLSLDLTSSRLDADAPTAMSSQRHIPSRALLSPRDYDEDAESLRSPSEQDSDSDDDEFLRNSRTTLELAEHDRAVLDDEEETEKLLTRGGPTHGIRRLFSPNRSAVRIGKQDRQQGRKTKKTRRGRQGKRQKPSDVMFEMEEGHREDDSSLLSASSSDLDRTAEKKYNYVPV